MKHASKHGSTNATRVASRRGRAMSDELKVAICTPCQDMIHATFAMDVSLLLSHSVQAGVKCAMYQNRGTILPMQRAELVQVALNHDATHVLFVDSDMRFPKDALIRLLEH